MTAIRAIAFLTVKEAIRNKILYLLLFFSIVLILFSWITSELTIGDDLKIIKDIGISSIHFFGVLITVFIGIGLLFKEMEKRTIYLILSKPVSRPQFLLGKFLGLALTLLLVLGSLLLIFYVLLALKGDPDTGLLLSFYFIYFEWLLLAAIAVVFSSFSTPLLSTMLTLAAFLAGHLTESLLLLKARVHTEAARAVLSTLYHVLPNLEMFNIRSKVVYGLPLSASTLLETSAYGFLYLSSLLLLAILIFQRKDFT